MDEENRNAAICVTDDGDFVTKETDGSLGTEKAKIKKIIVVVLALLFVFQIIYEVSSFIPGFEKKYFIKNFSDHRELMEKWVDKMTEMFDSEITVHDDLEYISLIPYLPSYNNGVFNFSCFLADGTKYNIAVPATDDDYDALMDVQCDIPNPHGFFDDENSGEGGLCIFVTDKQVYVVGHQTVSVDRTLRRKR